MHKQLNCHATENTSSIQGSPHISLIPKGIFKPQLVTHFKQNGKTQNKICPLLVYYSGIWHEQRMQVITQIKRSQKQKPRFSIPTGSRHMSCFHNVFLVTVDSPTEATYQHSFIHIYFLNSNNAKVKKSTLSQAVLKEQHEIKKNLVGYNYLSSHALLTLN